MNIPVFVEGDGCGWRPPGFTLLPAIARNTLAVLRYLIVLLKG